MSDGKERNPVELDAFDARIGIEHHTAQHVSRFVGDEPREGAGYEHADRSNTLLTTGGALLSSFDLSAPNGYRKCNKREHKFVRNSRA